MYFFASFLSSDNEVAAVPYQYTGNSSEVIFSLNKILTICPTLAKPEEDYLLLVANSKEVEPETIETA